MKERDTLIEKLKLIPHPEGGFFREIYRSGATPMQSKGATDLEGITTNFKGRGIRNILTSIYWMLTKESPIGWWIKNRSDHVHYHHAGATVTYYVIDEKGALSKHCLGKNVLDGDVMQLVVKGGSWKASTIGKEDYALIGEAVAPGFDASDFEIGKIQYFKANYAAILKELPHLMHPSSENTFESFY